MSRKLKLLSMEISSLLMTQLGHELENYTLYKMFANYYAVEGILPLEEYFKKRADEELLHHDWVFNYLNEADCDIQYPNVKIEKKISSLIDPFVQTIAKEIETTQMIYKIADQALKEKDYMTFNWLNQHLIKEQIEEENTSRMAKQIMELEADLLEKAEQVLELLED